VLTVLFLCSATFALIEARGGHLGLVALAFGVGLGCFDLFLRRERRTGHPLLPLSLFRVRQFRAANAVTFVVYGAISPFFFLLVLQLQVVCGWSPLAAGAASIPVTLITLGLSRRSGALAQRIGPRWQMSLGPLACAAGCVWATSIGAHSDSLADVLGPVCVFGLGLATMVAPLTATALGSLPAAHAGLASGVNNALARTASLLAIAAIPVLAGLDGDAVMNPPEFAAGFERGLYLCATLFTVGGLLAAATIRRLSAAEALTI
jgi:hypothetical protein